MTGGALAHTLRPGTPAPDFTLADIRTGGPVRLASLRGRPVVLVFGSFGCDVLCSQLGRLRELYREYGRRVQFLFVYVTEAPHEGGLPDARGDRARRAALVRAAWEGRGLPFPCLLDGPDCEAEEAYRAWPLRLVLVGADGRVLADLGRGLPAGWDLRQARDKLKRVLAPRVSAGQAGRLFPVALLAAAMK
jgi:hypothetical protein